MCNGAYAIAHNCRCTTIAAIDGFEIDRVESSPKVKNMSFAEWQRAKE